VLGAGPTVTLEDLPGWIAAGWTTPALALESQSYREGLNAAKKQLISKALATTNGNRSAAAKILGIEAKYLLRLMKSFHIK
jgi:DNA-binding NtrC family response regulator